MPKSPRAGARDGSRMVIVGHSTACLVGLGCGGRVAVGVGGSGAAGTNVLVGVGGGGADGANVWVGVGGGGADGANVWVGVGGTGVGEGGADVTVMLSPTASLTPPSRL